MPKVKIKSAPKAKNGKSVKPIDSNTVLFKGPSHAKGGIDISYGGNKVEVEGQETGYISPLDNSLNVMGNMLNPLTGKKFKDDSKVLAKKERKVDELLSYSLKLIDDSDPNDRWEQLKFNAGSIMAQGATKKKKEIADSKEHLALIQNAMLERADELGADAQEFSKGKLTKAKYGKKLAAGGSEDPKPWEFRGTNTKNLDKNILNFVKLLEKKGLTGYSGEQSGYSKRNTKSGRLSRHAQNQALDLFFDKEGAYDAIVKDPELSAFLINSGLTVINEYDPNIAKQTGATAGHIHVGYDKGTNIADMFRSQAAQLYKKNNPNWSWGKTDGPGKKSQKGLPYGDVYNTDDLVRQEKDKYKKGVDTDATILEKLKNSKNNYNPRKVAGSDYTLSLQNPKKYDRPTNAKGLSFDQIVPELYSLATNQQDPVWLQQYNPELYQDYEVSFQDRLNENNATFSSLQRTLKDNPSALATLAAQKYSADSQVLADEFRTNQAVEQDIVNKNKGLLNDAQLKNLGLADIQYERQSRAKSITKDTNRAVLSSIADKVHLNRYEQMTQKLYENLYPHYSFDKNTGEAIKVGAPGQEYIDWEGVGDVNSSSDMRTRTEYNPTTGKPTKYTEIQPSPLDTAIKEQKLQNQTPLMQKLKSKNNLIPNYENIFPRFRKR